MGYVPVGERLVAVVVKATVTLPVSCGRSPVRVAVRAGMGWP